MLKAAKKDNSECSPAVVSTATALKVALGDWLDDPGHRHHRYHSPYQAKSLSLDRKRAAQGSATAHGRGKIQRNETAITMCSLV